MADLKWDCEVEYPFSLNDFEELSICIKNAICVSTPGAERVYLEEIYDGIGKIIKAKKREKENAP